MTNNYLKTHTAIINIAWVKSQTELYIILPITYSNLFIWRCMREEDLEKSKDADKIAHPVIAELKVSHRNFK